MIDVKELRRDNLIYEIVDTPNNPTEQRLFKVAGVNALTNTLTDFNDNITQADYCDPISLTPEVLQKLGFKINRSKYTYEEMDIVEENGAYELLVHNEYTIGKSFKYAHQLQNIAFWMYGYELTINE